MRTKKSEKELLGILNRRNNPEVKVEPVEKPAFSVAPINPILRRDFNGEEKSKRFVTVGIDVAKGKDKTVTTVLDKTPVDEKAKPMDSVKQAGRYVCQQIVNACENLDEKRKNLIEELKNYKAPEAKPVKGFNSNTFLVFFTNDSEEHCQYGQKWVPIKDEEIVAIEFDDKYVTLTVVPQECLNMSCFLGDNRADSFGDMSLTLLTKEKNLSAVSFTNLRLQSLQSSTVIKSECGFYETKNEAQFYYTIKFRYEKAL